MYDHMMIVVMALYHGLGWEWNGDDGGDGDGDGDGDGNGDDGGDGDGDGNGDDGGDGDGDGDGDGVDMAYHSCPFLGILALFSSRRKSAIESIKEFPIWLPRFHREEDFIPSEIEITELLDDEAEGSDA